VFVAPNGNGWKATQGGRTVSEHRKQQPAIDSGRREAKHDAAELNVQGRNGLRLKNTYGHDPFPPKG
jgi:Uncharacterized protein conserved in bacteria (DUF2188)